jgi:hypothetical protein
MSTQLWQKNGGPPVVLPFADFMPDGTYLTDLINQPESRARLGWVMAPPPTDELPLEIPMHKARKAMRMLGPAGRVFDQIDTSWMELVEQVRTNIPDKVLRGQLLDDLDTAPNMVLAGDNTMMIRNAIGMSQEQMETVARLALTLP